MNINISEIRVKLVVSELLEVETLLVLTSYH